MDNALKLQMDIKNNAEDLRTYLLELRSWEDEMKRKESELKREKPKVMDLPPPRNKIKRNNSLNTDMKNGSDKEKKPKRITAYDYSSWDKYDADKACEEIDEGTSEEKSTVDTSDDRAEKEEKEETQGENEEESFQNSDEAFYEKELGNQYVKKEKWEDAISCYTRAINLDPHNAIYHANRALCFIKLKNFKAGEVDATIAVQLDKTYVKAFQRRAFARMALGQLKEAIEDYEEVLKLEPNNALANLEVNKLKKKLENPAAANNVKKDSLPVFNPKIIFKSKPVKPVTSSVDNETSNVSSKLVSEKEKLNIKDSNSVEKKTKKITETLINKCKASDGNVVNVDSNRKKESNAKIDKDSAVNSSKQSLDDDIFGEIPEGFSVVKPIYIPPHKRSKKPLRSITIKDVISDSDIFDEFNNLSNHLHCFRGKSEDKAGINVLPSIEEEQIVAENYNFQVPETCLQFQSAWKFVRTSSDNTYCYLKKINPENIPNIFKHSLESDLFSQLLSSLAQNECLSDPDFLYSFLYHLSCVNRIGPLTMFMSSADKENLNKCFSCLRKSRSAYEIDELRRRYEM